MNAEIFKVLFDSLQEMDNPADLLAKVNTLKEKYAAEPVLNKNLIQETIALIHLMSEYALAQQRQLAQSLYQARHCIHYNRDT